MSVPHRHLYCRMPHPLRNSPDIYTWNAAEEEQTIYDVPVSGGGIPWTVDPPTNLTLTHTSVDFGARASGSGILVSWTPSDDGYVSSTIIQYSSDGGSTWISGGTVPNPPSNLASLHCRVERISTDRRRSCKWRSI